MPTVAQALDLLDQRIAAVFEAFTSAKVAIAASRGRLTTTSKIEAVQIITADFFGITRRAMLSRDRHAHIALARQTAITLVREFTSFTLHTIGQEFGGFDHGTICWATKAVRNRAEVDPDFAEQLATLRNLVGQAFNEAGFRVPTKMGENSKGTAREFSAGGARV
jgi:chromosomal replication initiation ATPase DnaA